MALWRNLMAVWSHPPMLTASRGHGAPGPAQPELESVQEAGLEAESVDRDVQVDARWHSHVSIPPQARAGKMEVAMALIDRCLAAEDKVIFFSQSLAVLDFVERWLESKGLVEGMDTLRLQGGVSARMRQEMCVTFNTTSRPKVFLVSIQVSGCSRLRGLRVGSGLGRELMECCTVGGRDWHEHVRWQPRHPV